MTEIYENGEAVPAEKIGELKQIYARLLAGAEFVTLSGSLSPGAGRFTRQDYERLLAELEISAIS